jgi:hypothetical protein
LDVRSSSGRGDLEAVTESGSPARIEVKATSASAFQQLGDKDLDAHVLLWIHFDDYFWNPDTDSVSVFFLTTPRKVFPKPRKLSLQKFIDSAGSRLLHTPVNVSELLRGETSSERP